MEDVVEKMMAWKSAHQLQDFIVDLISPDLNGLLESMSESYKAVINQHGNGLLFFIFEVLTCGTWDRRRGR